MQKYKDIWYGSTEINSTLSNNKKIFIWIISDRKDLGEATVYYFNSDLYRLDQCIDKFKKEVYEEKCKRDVSRFRGYA